LIGKPGADALVAEKPVDMEPLGVAWAIPATTASNSRYKRDGKQVYTTDALAQLFNLVSKTELIAIRKAFWWPHP
jgi:hypothetical protein